MANNTNYTYSGPGNSGRKFKDEIDQAHINSTLTDKEKRALQTLLTDALNALGGADLYLDRAITSSLRLHSGSSPSLTLSVVIA